MFASDLEYMLREFRNIVYWFAGHTHKASEIHIENTQIIVNPVGYPGENYDINWCKKVEVGAGPGT
jgi:hypothetical protein